MPASPARTQPVTTIVQTLVIEKPLTAAPDRYERDVQREIVDLLYRGGLGILQSAAQVRYRPRYFSAARGQTIEFDLSIELTMPETSLPFLRWIWECKSSVSKISVDEVEEFWAKLQQVGSAGIKGTMVSAGGYQSGSIEFAKSTGLGLARFVPGHSVDHLVYSILDAPELLSPSSETLERMLSDPRIILPSVRFVAISESDLYQSLGELARAVFASAQEAP